VRRKAGRFSNGKFVTIKKDGTAGRKASLVSLFRAKTPRSAKNFDKNAKKSEKAPAKDLIFLAFCIRMNYGKKYKAQTGR
jgi:hypothetical protein